MKIIPEQQILLNIHTNVKAYQKASLLKWCLINLPIFKEKLYTNLIRKTIKTLVIARNYSLSIINSFQLFFSVIIRYASNENDFDATLQLMHSIFFQDNIM